MMIKKVSGQSLCSPCHLGDPFRINGQTSSNFKVRLADNPGFIAWWLEPKRRVRRLLQTARFKETVRARAPCDKLIILPTYDSRPGHQTRAV